MAGPTTYFGPGDRDNTLLKPGIILSFSIKLEDDAEVSLVVGEPAGKGNPNPQKNLKLSIDSLSGNWTCGDANGTGAQFAKSRWHNVSLTMASTARVGGDGPGGCEGQLTLDGAVLGSVAKCATGSLVLTLSRYIYAMVDDFNIHGA
jgi:hypothetical protein